MTIYYQDDYVTLYHGDALEIDAWLSADVLVTDPPYGIGWKQPDLPAGVGNRGSSGAFAKHDGILNDNDTITRDKVLEEWGDNAAIVFSAWTRLPAGIRQVLTWHKPSTTGVIGAKYGYRRDTEAICLLGKHENRPVSRSSVISTNGTHTAYANGTHPHAKPVALMEALIEWTEGVIADPFAGGSGNKSFPRFPVNFRPSLRVREVWLRDLSGNVGGTVNLSQGGYLNLYFYEEGVSAYFNIRYETSDAWPDSLPGTPA